MSWARPEWLHLLWAVPVLAALLWAALRRRQALLARLGPLAGERVSARAQRVHRRRAVLWLSAMVFGVLALAQPRWGYRWQELKREGLDLVVVLDVSRSMDVEDVSPSRMEQAQREVLDLTEMLAGDRVGLVVFAGGAYARMPLTLDYAVLRHQVRDSSSQTLVAQGSDIGAAIDMAVDLLGPPGASDRAILLVSDGEDHVGEAIVAAERATEADVHIYTMGVGTPEGAPIPNEGGGFKKDRSGQVVMAKLDESVLQEVARIGRGAYVRAGASNRDIAAIYMGEIRGRLQGAEQGVRRERLWDERFSWPLAVAILLLVAASFVRPGPLRLPGAMLALLLVAAPARAQDAVPTSADELLARQADRPDDLRLAEELGLTLLKEGRSAEAHDVLSQVAERTLDPTQRQRARYNAGHAAYRSGRLTRAVEDWRRVLEDRPDHPAAQQNVQLVEQEIARRLQQEPPPQDPQGEPQDPQGEPQDPQGEPQDPQGEPQDPQGEPQDPDDGTLDPGEPGGDTGMPGDMSGMQTDDAGEPTDDTPKLEAPRSGTRAGEITAEEAARMVDAVEEGQPRVVARPGAAGDKDW